MNVWNINKYPKETIDLMLKLRMVKEVGNHYIFTSYGRSVLRIFLKSLEMKPKRGDEE